MAKNSPNSPNSPAGEIEQESTVNGDTVGTPKQLSELTESNKRLKRKIFDLYTIFEISRHLNTVLDTEQLLDGIILTCIGQMGVSAAAVFTLRGHDSYDLQLAKQKGLSIDIDDSMVISERSPILQLFHSVHGKPLSYGQIEEKVGASEEVRLLETIECEYLIPMTLQNRIRGLLSVTKKISGTAFFEDDLEFLAILANQLSVAVENARLFESEKEAVRQLHQAQMQLVQAEKLAALGQLSARVAHEVNNPLGIIKNYLLMFNQAVDDKPEVREYVDVVTEEVDRIAGIVRQLLSMFKPKSKDFKPTSLETVIDETMLLISLQARKMNVEIDCKLPRNLPMVRGASEQLKQVFLNLLMNACDFMPDGGRIEISGNVNDGSIEVSVKDTGPGLPQENFQKIFEPFFTTKSGGLGTGLGLSVCESIIKAHNGSISAKNDPDGGAKFTMTLPILEGDGTS